MHSWKISQTNCHQCVTPHAIESYSEEIIYQVDEEACEDEDIAHSCSRQTPSIHLHVVVSTAFS